MEAQEIFNKVVTHLRTQGVKAMDNTWCRFRTDQGLKCAAGCLIQDDEYQAWMDNCSSISEILIQSQCPMSLQIRLRRHTNLIYALQSVHDLGVIDKWEQNFKEVSHNFNLNYTEPQ